MSEKWRQPLVSEYRSGGAFRPVGESRHFPLPRRDPIDALMVRRLDAAEASLAESVFGVGTNPDAEGDEDGLGGLFREDPTDA